MGALIREQSSIRSQINEPESTYSKTRETSTITITSWSSRTASSIFGQVNYHLMIPISL